MIIDRGNVDKYDVNGILSVFLYYSAVYALITYTNGEKDWRKDCIWVIIYRHG